MDNFDRTPEFTFLPPIAPETVDSEAWAKPYYIQGREWSARHKRKDFRVFFCEDKAETPCAWLQ